MITHEYVKQKMNELSEKYPKYQMCFEDLADEFVRMMDATEENAYQYASGAASGEKHIISTMLIGDPDAFDEVSETTYALWSAIHNQHYSTTLKRYKG